MADLRSQYRVRPGVQGTTADRVEIMSPIWVSFSLGQLPEVLTVAYKDEKSAENLRVVYFLEQENGDLIVDFMSDELDLSDKVEIHNNVHKGNMFNGLNKGVQNTSETNTPYYFNPQRVFSAIYSEATDIDEDFEYIPWDHLPVHVAAAIFRDVLSTQHYSYLYSKDYPLSRFRAVFSRRVRNQGVLLYQYVEKKDGCLLDFATIVNPQDLKSSPEYELNNSKVLRDRGIKIISAGFSDLIPMDYEMLKQRRFNSFDRNQKIKNGN